MSWSKAPWATKLGLVSFRYVAQVRDDWMALMLRCRATIERVWIMWQVTLKIQRVKSYTKSSDIGMRMSSVATIKQPNAFGVKVSDEQRSSLDRWYCGTKNNDHLQKNPLPLCKYGMSFFPSRRRTGKFQAILWLHSIRHRIKWTWWRASTSFTTNRYALPTWSAVCFSQLMIRSPHCASSSSSLLEAGQVDPAEKEKARIEQAQRSRPATGLCPRWFKEEGESFILIQQDEALPLYWKKREDHWQSVEFIQLW